MMKSAILIVLVLQLLHLPVPYPDLDGECLGTPIASLAEGNAWHMVLLGVLPNDDVDRGPIRSRDERTHADLSLSPFGDPAMVVASHVSASHMMGDVQLLAVHLPSELGPAGGVFRSRITSTISDVRECRVALRHFVLRV